MGLSAGIQTGGAGEGASGGCLCGGAVAQGVGGGAAGRGGDADSTGDVQSHGIATDAERDV